MAADGPAVAEASSRQTSRQAGRRAGEYAGKQTGEQMGGHEKRVASCFKVETMWRKHFSETG